MNVEFLSMSVDMWVTECIVYMLVCVNIWLCVHWNKNVCISPLCSCTSLCVNIPVWMYKYVNVPVWTVLIICICVLCLYTIIYSGMYVAEQCKWLISVCVHEDVFACVCLWWVLPTLLVQIHKYVRICVCSFMCANIPLCQSLSGNVSVNESSFVCIASHMGVCVCGMCMVCISDCDCVNMFCKYICIYMSDCVHRGMNAVQIHVHENMLIGVHTQLCV